CIFFFFQAEDGIRDFHVTGVQTCALPIYIRACNMNIFSGSTSASSAAPATVSSGDAGSASRPCAEKPSFLSRRISHRTRCALLLCCEKGLASREESSALLLILRKCGA